MGQPSDTSKDSALRAVGRAIVNFQRLEHNLKLAAQLGPLRGTLQKVQRDIAKRHERAETLTLGQAIQAWLNYCDGTPAEVGYTPDLFDMSIHTTFSLESDAESRISHAKALTSLLEIRNDLIHTRLARFQWESPEACNKLVVELDVVNAAIAEQLEYIGSLLAAILSARKQHAESIAGAFTGRTAMDNDERNA